MGQFKSRDFTVSQGASLPGSTGPVTPPPLPRVRVDLPHTNRVQRRQIAESYSEEKSVSDDYRTQRSGTPTQPIPVIKPAIPNATDRTTGSIKRLYTNRELVGMDLLTCAIRWHIRTYKIIPRHLSVSRALKPSITEDVKDLYDETFNGTVPFLTRQEVIIRISIYFDDVVPRDTVYFT